MKILYKFIFILLSVAMVCNADVVSAQDYEHKNISTSEKKMTAYPIPANTAIFIKLSPALKSETRSVELINLIGRRVAFQSITGTEGGDIVLGGLNQLPEGAYISIAKNASGKILQTSKIVVQH